MPNERLRGRLAAAQLTVDDLASRAEVDSKTVERWITQSRVPHRTHRWATAKLLGTDEAYLWPEVVDEVRTRAASDAEFVTLYPHRGAVPTALWHAPLDEARDSIDVLAYAALFLTDGTYSRLPNVLADKASNGVQVRLALGVVCGSAAERPGRCHVPEAM